MPNKKADSATKTKTETKTEIKRSAELFSRALKRIPGGVNSPVRAFRSVGGTPRFIQAGKGCRVTDVDGNTYIDYVGSWGPLILGHCPVGVRAALKRQVELGTSYGASTENEVVLAEMVAAAVPSIDKVRLVNSGTEATMSAVRLARAFTGRSKIVKFDGCYHGHVDSLLVKAGSGVATLGLPDSPGLAADCAATLSIPYNDEEALRQVFALNPDEIAAVIVEPVPGNMGVVPPAKGYLKSLRKVTQEHGALLIFDEVITGFRLSYGGAQKLLGVKPDLTCLGKVIGGGLPVGAYGGRRDIMKMVAPEGPVYQAGTLSGNPLAVSAGIAALTALAEPDVYRRLEEMTALMVDGLRKAADDEGAVVTINTIGSMFTVFFTSATVTDFQSAKACDTARYAKFFHALLDRGVYFPPSQFETCFISLAHTKGDVKATLAAAREAFAAAR
ncbi:MAG: glutamate-1-semialdehyde 2,1-aminomutase [Acidobacteriota bacterium]|jgi:glutamate-1-semialdehyde 2,1-aminomutase|nr:glutamate-1-semialdehyde 2,1-aminomutase [Acidobacteriota bacterium]